jgi:hypothetical protein
MDTVAAVVVVVVDVVGGVNVVVCFLYPLLFLVCVVVVIPSI